MENPAGFVPIQFGPEDLAFFQARWNLLAEITRAYGLPELVMGKSATRDAMRGLRFMEARQAYIEALFSRSRQAARERGTNRTPPTKRKFW